MKSVSKVVILLFAIGIAGVALLSIFKPEMQSPIFARLLSVVPWAGYTHIVCGSLALLLGGIQLSSRIRRKNLELHKLTGKAYVACVLASSIGAIVSLSFTSSPWAAKSAFWLLAICWPTATLMGYPRGMKFDFAWHGKLMTYSYAMTCAAISLRILLGVQMGMGVGFSTAYPIAAWGGFLINVAIAFVALRFISRRSKSISSGAAV
jgi:uncharacterized membrane protein